MDLNEKIDIDILILDGDAFFNDLVARKLNDLKNRPDIKQRFSLKVEQFVRPREFLNRVTSKKNSSKPSMAFVEFFPGDGLSGHNIIKILRRQNEFINVILMSQSETVFGKSTDQQNPANTFTRILKHEYSPDICCILVENYINNI